MCKLNIHCSEDDGKCNCHQKLCGPSTQSSVSSNLLCSILSFISSQPEILQAMSDGKVTPSDISSISLVPQDEPLNPASSKEQLLSINLLNDLPSKVFVNKSFSCMIEVVDQNFNKVDLGEDILFQVALVSKEDNSEIAILGECETKSTGLFKRLEVQQKYENCSLVIRTPYRADISSFSSDIKILTKKAKAVKASS